MVGQHDGISKEMTCPRRHCEPLTNSKASPSVEDWNWLSPSIPTKAIRKTAGCSPDAGNAASRRTIESTAYRRKHPRANPHWRDWIEDYRGPSTAFAGLSSPRPDEDSAREYVEEYGFDLIDVIVPGTGGVAALLVKCRNCGRQSVERDDDILFRCSCQRHPNTKPPLRATRRSGSPKDHHEPHRNGTYAGLRRT